MKRRFLAAAAAALALAVLLSGCGDGEKTPEKQTAGINTEAPDDPENVRSDLNADETI